VKVVLTRAAGGSSALPERLRAAGFEVEECPLIRVEPLPGPPLRADGYDWLVLTSRNAVEPLRARLAGSLPRVAVVGQGTAEAVRSLGVEPALVASTSTQEGLVADFPRPPGRVLFAGAEGARELLARELGADFVPLYRTLEVAPETFPRADLVLLASPSAARSLARLGRDLPCVSIGPITTQEAARVGLRVASEASRPDLDGLLEAVKLAASSSGSSPS
jgi:uroporphyrinogen-III synthase